MDKFRNVDGSIAGRSGLGAGFTAPPKQASDSAVVLMVSRAATPADVDAIAREIAQELRAWGSVAFIAKRVAPGAYELQRIVPPNDVVILTNGVALKEDMLKDKP